MQKLSLSTTTRIPRASNGNIIHKIAETISN